MATVIKTKATGTANRQPANGQYQEPKRLSKYALWRRENPNGIGIVKDWRAVNK